jgi:hypothetical protein
MGSKELDLNTLKIPLAELRVLVVQLMKDGIQEVPLGDFLLMLKPLAKKGGDADSAS